jgi:hypothetical protein
VYIDAITGYQYVPIFAQAQSTNNVPPSPLPAQSFKKSFWKNMDTHLGGRFKTTGTGSRVTDDTIFAPVGTGIMTAAPISD